MSNAEDRRRNTQNAERELEKIMKSSPLPAPQQMAEQPGEGKKCENIGSDSSGKITVVCQLPKGHTGNHGGMGCEWNDKAGAWPSESKLREMADAEDAVGGITIGVMEQPGEQELKVGCTAECVKDNMWGIKRGERLKVLDIGVETIRVCPNVPNGFAMHYDKKFFRVIAPAAETVEKTEVAKLVEELRQWDKDFQRGYGPNEDKPDLVELRKKIYRRCYQLFGVFINAYDLVSDQSASITTLEAELRQSKEHHEFYRSKVSEYQGAEQKLLERFRSLQSTTTDLAEQLEKTKGENERLTNGPSPCLELMCIAAAKKLRQNGYIYPCDGDREEPWRVIYREISDYPGNSNFPSQHLDRIAELESTLKAAEQAVSLLKSENNLLCTANQSSAKLAHNFWGQLNDALGIPRSAVVSEMVEEITRIKQAVREREENLSRIGYKMDDGSWVNIFGLMAATTKANSVPAAQSGEGKQISSKVQDSGSNPDGNLPSVESCSSVVRAGQTRNVGSRPTASPARESVIQSEGPGLFNSVSGEGKTGAALEARGRGKERE